MKIVRLIVLILISTISYIQAQPVDPGGGTNPNEVPITGIEILIAAGGILGIKKYMDRRKNK